MFKLTTITTLKFDYRNRYLIKLETFECLCRAFFQAIGINVYSNTKKKKTQNYVLK